MLWMFIYFSICYLCSLEKANVVFFLDNITAVIYMSFVSITCVGEKTDGSFILKKANTTF